MNNAKLFVSALLFTSMPLITACVNQPFTATESQKTDLSISVSKLSPNSPATLAVGEKITVTLRYSFSNPKTLRIWAQPMGVESKWVYESSHLIKSGQGEVKRYFLVNKPAKFENIRILVKNKYGKIIYKDAHIVNYTYVSGAAGAEVGESDWQALVIRRSSGYQVKGVTEIDVATTKALYERGVPFVDVRGKSFLLGHIPGSYNLRWRDAEFTEAALLEIVDKDQEVVIYCGVRLCKLSPNASAQALIWGFNKIYYFADGFPGWKAAGYSVEVSSE